MNKTIFLKHFKNTINIFKEGNIKVSIEGEGDCIFKVIFYEVEDSNGSKNAKCIYDSNIIRSGTFVSETLDYNSKNYPNKILIYIRGENVWFDIIYDKLRDTFYRINTMRYQGILNEVLPPIIITGARGGGTSYITKLLNCRGLYLGTDSGNFNLRKPYESITFTSVKDGLSFEKGSYTSWFDENDLLDKREKIKKTPFYYSVLMREELEYKFTTFWGDVGLNSIWGWKDPTTSIALPSWKLIFPECRLIIITRNKDRISNNMYDIEGNWFRNEASENILKLYLKPDIRDFSKDDVFYCNFNEVVKDIDSMNEMLSWVGLQTLNNKDEFVNFLKDTGYEGDL